MDFDFMPAAPSITERFECISCVLVGDLIEKIEQYGLDVFNASMVPAQWLLATAVGVWAAGILLLAIAGEIHPRDVIKGMFAIFAVSTFLSAAGWWFEYFFDTVNQLITGLSVMALNQKGSLTGPELHGDFADLARAIEMESRKVWMVARAMMTEGGVMHLHITIAGVALLIPFFFVFALYLGQLSVAWFRIAAVTVLSPWLAICGAFKSTRPFMSAGLKTMFSSVLVVVIATVGMALILYIFGETFSKLPVSGDQVIVTDMSEFAWSDRYWMVILIGWLGIAWQWEAATIASGIGGVFLNSVGPALFAAGVTATAALPFKLGALPLQVAGNRLGNKATDAGIDGTRRAAGKAWNAAAGGMSKMAQYNQARYGSPDGGEPKGK